LVKKYSLISTWFQVQWEHFLVNVMFNIYVYIIFTINCTIVVWINIIHIQKGLSNEIWWMYCFEWEWSIRLDLEQSFSGWNGEGRGLAAFEYVTVKTHLNQWLNYCSPAFNCTEAFVRDWSTITRARKKIYLKTERKINPRSLDVTYKRHVSTGRSFLRIARRLIV